MSFPGVPTSMTLKDLEPQNRGFKWFFWLFLAATHTYSELSLKYTGDRPRQPAYEIKLMLWRVSWALAQISYWLSLLTVYLLIHSFIHCTYSWGSPLWTDFNQILHIRRYARRNHLCIFWYGKTEGFGKYGGQSLGSPIETTGQPYNSAALPHSLWLLSAR